MSATDTQPRRCEKCPRTKNIERVWHAGRDRALCPTCRLRWFQ